MKNNLVIMFLMIMYAFGVYAAGTVGPVEEEIRTYLSDLSKAVVSRDFDAVGRMILKDEIKSLCFSKMRKSKPLHLRYEYISIVSEFPLVISANQYMKEPGSSEVPLAVELTLKKADDRYVLVEARSPQLEKVEIQTSKAKVGSEELILYVNRGDTNSVLRLFGAKNDGAKNFKFREFLKKKEVEWIDDVMKENRRIEGGWASSCDPKDASKGASSVFNEYDKDGVFKCMRILLFRGEYFEGRYDPAPIVHTGE